MTMNGRAFHKLLVATLVTMVAFVLFAAAAYWHQLSASQNSDLQVNPPLVEFGAISANGRHRHGVLLTNNSRSTIRFGSASSGCGCTSIEGLPDHLDPGEKSEIIVLLDTSGMNNGVIERTISFPYTSDGAAKYEDLKLTGQVSPALFYETTQLPVIADAIGPLFRSEVKVRRGCASLDLFRSVHFTWPYALGEMHVSKPNEDEFVLKISTRVLSTSVRPKLGVYAVMDQTVTLLDSFEFQLGPSLSVVPAQYVVRLRRNQSEPPSVSTAKDFVVRVDGKATHFSLSHGGVGESGLIEVGVSPTSETYFSLRCNGIPDKSVLCDKLSIRGHSTISGVLVPVELSLTAVVTVLEGPDGDLESVTRGGDESP